MDKDVKAITNLYLDLRRANYDFPVDKASIVVQLDLLNKAIGRLKVVQREAMMKNDQYYKVINILRYDLQSNIKTSQDFAWKQQLIKMRDQIFGSKLKGLFAEEQKQIQASRVFIKFIEGITSFANERPYNMRDLIYHKNGSCSKNGTANFDCTATKNRSHKMSNTHLIEKCLIERLIYDHLWSHIERLPQDIGHVEWLEKTRLAYTSCVPFGSIEIKVEEYEIMPVKLEIKRYINGVCVDVETYKKKWDANSGTYNDDVYCIKRKPLINGGYTKNQTYAGVVPWINLNPKKRRDVNEFNLDDWLKTLR